MTPSPIRKVLLTFKKHRVRSLLMGGQACILYGAAEFSRDADFAILAQPGNLKKLQAALAELRAEQVYVPALDREVLEAGHACHFRCHYPDCQGLRIDVMSVMRGCDPFPILWQRRQRFVLAGIGTVNTLALPDLVKAKMTQRDRDWPMIRRLLEADYYAHATRPSQKQLRFWLSHARTPEILIELCRQFPRTASRLAAQRPALQAARRTDREAVSRALLREENAQREADRRYWQPLRRQLA